MERSNHKDSEIASFRFSTRRSANAPFAITIGHFYYLDSLTEFKDSLTEFKASLMELKASLMELKDSSMEFKGSLMYLN
ncbi:hypothetical protein FM036_12035 [Nostoc sp. HG1]|nr:hypothetical protein [Nostoc sp. HG1]